MAEILSTLSSDGLAGTPIAPGERYVLMATWESAQQASTGSGDSAVLECYKGTTVEGAWQADGSLDERLTLSGWVTSVTDNLIIRPAEGEGHNGVYGQGFTIKYSGTNNSVIALLTQYTTIKGITLSKSADDSSIVALTSNSSNFSQLSQCIIDGAGLGVTVLARITSNADQIITNCLMIGGGVGIDIVNRLRIKLDNNTVIGAAIVGIRSTASDTEIINCVAYANATDFSANTNADVKNNASGDTTAPGTAPQTGIVEADFAAYSGGDYSPAPGGKLDGAGADLSVDFTTDIAGATRTVPWTIGAYIVAGGAGYTFNGPDIVSQTGDENIVFTFNENGEGNVASRFSDPGTYALAPTSDALPAGLTVNPTTGNIEGTPTEVVTRNITIRGTKS